MGRTTVERYQITASLLEGLIKNALGPLGKQIELQERTKAEADIAVATASVLAREKFVNWIEKTSEEYRPTIEVLPLNHVDNIAVQVIAAEVYTNFIQEHMLPQS